MGQITVYVAADENGYSREGKTDALGEKGQDCLNSVFGQFNGAESNSHFR